MVGANPHFLRRESRPDARLLRRVVVGCVLVSVSLVLVACGNSPGDGLATANVQAGGDTFDDRFPAPQFRDRFATANESFVQRQPAGTKLSFAVGKRSLN